MKRNIIMGALVLAALCAFSTPAFAQRGRVGFRGGVYRGGVGVYRGGYFGGYRGGYYGGYRGGINRGYYPGYYGYGGGFGLGLGTGLLLGNTYGGYGYGGYPSYGGYGGYAPYYGGYSYNYAPSTTYLPSTTYVAPAATYIDPAYSSVAIPADSSRTSGYYAPEPSDNAAHLRILAPADAQVWVGGVETGQTGPDRSFSSPPLTPGKAYTYEVKARWMNSGEPVEQTRKVKVEANRTTTVDFGRLAETK